MERMKWEQEDINYEELKNLLNLNIIRHRRNQSDLFIIFKIRNHLIKSYDLFQLIPFRIPQRHTRETGLFFFLSWNYQ